MDDPKLSQDNPSKRFKCSDCDANFAQERSLKRHDQHVHWGQSFSCTTCGKKFGRADSCKRHRRDCSGTPIKGTLISILPLDHILGPAGHPVGVTPTSKAGQTLIKNKFPDYIIRKKVKVTPWEPPKSATFKPSTASCTITVEESRKLDRELFGEDDLTRSPKICTSPPSKVNTVDLADDLYLSTDSDSVPSDFEDVVRSPNSSHVSNMADYTPSGRIQDTMMEIMSDLTIIQEMSSTKDVETLHPCMQEFHQVIQKKIKELL